MKHGAVIALPQRLPAARERRALSTDAGPFLKWVGGKGKLTRSLEALLPPGAELMRHVEPFVGGGAFFFARAPERALLCDVNHDLIETYLVVRDELEALMRHLRRLSLAHGEEHYYAARDRYNARDHETRAERAALFIYLNKTCFNGLYRVNKSGNYNVPMGSYKNPAILDAPTLRAASARLATAELKCTSFESLVRDARPGDFVYLDPPYEPLSRTANFTSYAQHGFSQADQTRLRDVYRELDRRGSKLMLSNSDVPFIRELYRGYRIHELYAARAVNCDASARGPVRELVICNYG